ncbi:MAG: VWA domain-containing protein [Pirellulales bacterium]
MGRWQIGFEYPYFLLLLLVLPFIWWIGFRSLAGLGPFRRWIALSLRSLVVLLIIAALAGIQWIWISDRITVIYLLDQSDSIPSVKRKLMLDYAIENVKQHRRKDDRAGLIIFGREASIEFPPLDENIPPIDTPESYMGKTDATNLESALKLAQATFPEDASRRVVVITDGNETLGSAAAVAQSMTEAGIGIDVVPVRLDTNAEVLVEKIDVPGQVRQGQVVDAKVVLHRYTEENTGANVDGKLIVTRRVGNSSEILVEDNLTLDRDVTVIPITHKIEQSAGYTYEAEFIPTQKSDDAISQNNRATAFSYARGKGKVLLIEDANNLGNYDPLIQALRRSEIEVDVRTSSQLFTSLVELQAYDSVILAGVPRTTGESIDQIESFSEDQIEMLVQSVQQFGMGLLMLGGPEAFGAGGWANTKIEEAMPVDFQIKNSKIEAVGALAMVMHASEIAQGNHWQKVIAKAALDVLGPMDYCGVIEYDALGDKWMWGDKNGMLKVGQNRAVMRSKISQMTPGDMPAFDPAMRLALNSLLVTPASTKHMIVISDGDPSPTSQGVLNGFANAQIKVSTVAVGAHGPAGHAELQRIATTTGGNYYVVTNANALPKIFVREARRVARPLVYEPEGGVVPKMTFRHDVLQGISDPLPLVKGFVLTQRKESPLVEVPVLSPMPQEPENASIVATWTYGLGRTAVFTSDAGKRWTSNWLDWPQYDQFFSQLVRWTMRPTEEDGKYQIATQTKDGKVQVVVTALDQEDKFKNFLEMTARGVTPDLKSFPIAMRQVAPGRYVGEFDTNESGSYILSVLPGPGQAPLTTGVNVPFSDEYRVRQANLSMLENLAKLKVPGGDSGTITPPLESKSLKEILAQNAYRTGLPLSRSLKDVWPWAVLLGSVLFFADVFVRRVALDVGAPLRWIASKISPPPAQADVERKSRLDRLRGQKSNVNEELDRKRSSLQFEPVEETSESASSASSEFSNTPSKSENLAPPPKSSSPDDESSNYTSRLLQAKRDAQKRKDS